MYGLDTSRTLLRYFATKTQLSSFFIISTPGMTTFNLPLILKTTNKFLSLMCQSNALITTPSQHSFTARKLSLDFMLYNTVMTFIWVKRSVVYMIEALAKNCQTSAIADHITSSGHNIKWDHFQSAGSRFFSLRVTRTSVQSSRTQTCREEGKRGWCGRLQAKYRKKKRLPAV